jgi:hypothetical protein
MSKNIALAGFILLFAGLWPVPVLASDTLHLGVKGGLTRSTAVAPGEWSGGNGFQVGAFGSVGVFERVEVQAEVSFTRRVTKKTLGDGVTTIGSNLVFDCLEVPILLRRPTRPVGSLTPAFFGGVYSAVRTRARSRSHIGPDTIDEDVGDLVERWDYGLVAGAGLEVPRRGFTWLGEMRYAHGLSDLNKPGTSSWRLRTFILTGGVKW